MKHLTFIFVLLLALSCKKEKVTTNDLGVVNILVTGKNNAREHFEKGLLLLHSFEYTDAKEAFLTAQKVDPNMAMAYWGEAMTYNHSLWQEQDYDKARTALAKLDGMDYKKYCSDLEIDFIKAVKILYQADKDKNDRDVAYANYMEKMQQKYPSNQEVSAFYALSLLGSVSDGRDESVYSKGAIIAKGILEENPNHPGALHYLIHSYDDPKHAHLALSAANSYAKVAPDASHALHMPSHIYVALGMWDQVIASNINSYQASLNRKVKKNLGNDARGYHAYHWLQYGYLQKEEFTKAKEMLLNMQQYANETPSKRARVHLIFLKGTYLIDSDDWSDEIANIKVDISDLNISARSKYQFLDGMKAYKENNLEKLDTVIQTLENDYNRESFVASDKGNTFCSGVTRELATRSDLIGSKIRQEQLLALKADLQGNVELAEVHFKKSIALHNSISYSYGPPSIQKPVHELYADWLIIQNRYEEAQEQYKAALKMAPKRRYIVKNMKKSVT